MFLAFERSYKLLPFVGGRITAGGIVSANLEYNDGLRWNLFDGLVKPDEIKCTLCVVVVWKISRIELYSMKDVWMIG